MLDNNKALSYSQILTSNSGKILSGITDGELIFVTDENKEDKIQFAFCCFRKGELMFLSPTAEMKEISSMVSFPIASNMRHLALYNTQSDRLELNVYHAEIFEENFIKASISFRDALPNTLPIILDSYKQSPTVEYHCKCNTVGGDEDNIDYFEYWTSETIQCSSEGCKERYHTSCLGDKNVNPASIHWQCPRCALEHLLKEAKHWGTGTVTNTCTIDGPLSGENKKLYLLFMYIT